MSTCLGDSLTTSPQWSHAEAVKHLVICEAACLLEKSTRSPVWQLSSRLVTHTRAAPPDLRREAAQPICRQGCTTVRASATQFRVQCAIPRRWRAPGGRYATSSPLELGQGDLNLGHATTAPKPGASSMRCTNVRFVLTAAQATTMQWEREACAPALTHGGGPWYRGHHTGPLNAPVARARRAVHSVC